MELNTTQNILANHASSPLRLPCGASLPNRYVKVAMYEHMSRLSGGPPNTRHFNLYRQWAEGNWGMIVTGNVQVKRDHLSLGRDIVVPDCIDTQSCAPFSRLAKIIHGHAPGFEENGTLAVMQLSHAGKQSANILGGRAPFVRPLAPSALPLNLNQDGGFISSVISSVLFQNPREMTHCDIDDVVDAFVRGAKLAAQSGFDGVELHAAHGYLIAEFISPNSNMRSDEYSAAESPLHFLRRIVEAIRQPGMVPDNFVLGIKLNAADYTQDSDDDNGTDEQRVLAHVRDISSWGAIDFIEISGGSYEDPGFMTESSTSNRRQALFSRFSQRALSELTEHIPDASRRPAVLLTGGFSNADIMASALSSRHADLLGIGRLSVLYPQLPKIFEQPQKLEGAQSTDNSTSTTCWWEDALEYMLVSLWTCIPQALRPRFPKLIGAGVEMAAYTVAMHAISRHELPGQLQAAIKPRIGHVLRMWTYVAPSDLWHGWWVLAMLIAVVTSAILWSLA